MKVRLTPEVLRQVQDHGQQTYPEECGGLLLGHQHQGVRSISSLVRLENQRSESRHNRVELSPLDYARGEREAARQGLGVWGFYHSHPDHLAVPSQYDLDQAGFVDWSYLIVPVAQGKAGPPRSYRLAEDRSRFEEETIEVTPREEVT